MKDVQINISDFDAGMLTAALAVYILHTDKQKKWLESEKNMAKANAHNLRTIIGEARIKAASERAKKAVDKPNK